MAVTHSLKKASPALQASASLTADSLSVVPSGAPALPGPASLGERRGQGLPVQLELVIEQSPIGVAVIDFEGAYVSVNPAYCAIYGYRRDEMLGNRFTMVFAPPQRERVLQRHQQFLTQGSELKGDWEVVRRDGAVLNIISESVRVVEDNGRACRLVYVVDITERKRMEIALRSSQQFFRAVLDGLTASICVLNGSGVIVAVNQAWREFGAANGGDATQMHEGASYLNACERAARSDSPAARDAALFLQSLHEVMAGKRDHFQLEYDCHSPTERRWFLARVSRLHVDGTHQIVIAHDNVSPLKLAQETLRQSEALMLDLAGSIPGGIFRFFTLPSGEREFTYLSPGMGTLLEIPTADRVSVGRAWRECLHPEDRAGYELSAREAASSQQVWEHEFRVQTRTGLTRWIHAKAVPQSNEQGRLVWTGVMTDVSDRKSLEAVLKDSEETYRTLFETVPQGVIYHDPQGFITSANPAAQRILGLSLEQLVGRQPADPGWTVVSEDGNAFPSDQFPTVKALRTREPVRDVLMGLSVPGRDRVWVQVTAIPLFKGGKLHQVYASFENITPRVLLSQQLQREASTDALTGAMNRRKLMDHLHGEFERVQRHAELSCSVLALDLDHFKRVNDTWGHAAGDAVLVHVTQLMQHEARRLDVVARSGGEEFVLLLPDTSVARAMGIAERVRLRVATTPLQHKTHEIAVTVSIGVSVIKASDAHPEAVLVRADQALYASKEAGRNAVTRG